MQISKINAILYREDKIRDQTLRGLEEVLFKGVPDAVQSFLEIMRVTSTEEQGIFSGAALTILIKNCLENYVAPIEDRMALTPDFGLDLLRTILIYNETFYKTSDTKELTEFLGLFQIDVAQQYYIRRERNIKYILMLKFAFLSKYFSEHPLLKTACIEYCQRYGLGTMWGLGQFFLHIFMMINNSNNADKHIIDRNGQSLPVLDQFILHKKDIENSSQLSLHMDLIPKPFYEINDRHLLLLDFNFFNYGLDQGITYSFYNSTSINKDSQFSTFNSFKSYLALNFYEQFFIGGLLKAIFSKRHQIIISDSIYQDFIVKVNGKDVLIIEVKTAEVHPNIMENKDFESFKNFLDKNFLADKTSGDLKNKGITQIIKQIEYLAAEDSKLREKLEIKHPGLLNIYPVIIYSDTMLDMNGVNEYINESFLTKISCYSSSFQSIKPLVMINGSSFLNYFKPLKDSPHDLIDWINDYFKSVKVMKKRFGESKGAFDYLRYNKSFTTHLSKKIQKDYISENLREIKRSFDFTIVNFGVQTS